MDLALAAAIGVIAAVYASVGQAGGTGYLAVLALAGLSPAEMKPAALVLNVLVATLGTVRFATAGHLEFRAYWPFLAGGVPAAFVGGAWLPPASVYDPLVGGVLLFAGCALGLRIVGGESPETDETEPPHVAVSLLVGAAIGLLAGVTGTGGGVFLAPVLLLWGWATARGAAALCATFVLANSASALAGMLLSPSIDVWQSLPDSMPIMLGCAGVGGWIGATVGALWLPPRIMQGILATVMLVASAKMLLTLAT